MMKFVVGGLTVAGLYLLHLFGYLTTPEVFVLTIWFVGGFAAFQYLLKP